MDFLDPLFNRRHITRLYIGYVLVAIAIFLAATMLVLIAKGYQLSKDGQVTQNGLLFASSKPVAAKLFIDGVVAGKQTNTRMNIIEGNYELGLKRDGYRDWQHRIQILGGKIARFDYPLLFPETLTTTNLQVLAATRPGIVTQTPDKRSLMLQQDPLTPVFTVFDLKNPGTSQVTLTVPAASYTPGGTQSWQVAGWADDNIHLLLKHGFGTKLTEFVLVNRADPSQSINLSALVKIQTDRVSFVNNKFDHYYLYSNKDQILRSATLKAPVPVVIANKVLEFEPYGEDELLYVVPASDSASQVEVHLKQGEQDYILRQLPKASRYYLAASEYSGNSYIAVADPAKPLVYVYKNAAVPLANSVLPVPVVALKIAASNFLSFSAGGRFVVAENGTNFTAYDAEYKQVTIFTMPQPIDKGQIHATWLDGAHLQYVSNQQLYVFDYDGTNAQMLVPAVPNERILYDADFRFVYTIAPPIAASQQKYVLTSTPLRTPADQ